MLNGQTPFDALQTYVSLSPIYHLENVGTPLMLVVGDSDQRLLDHIYMFDGLRRLGREVSLVRYPGEGHAIASNSAIKDYLKRTNEFIDKYLKPDRSFGR
jgi:dipeptidyl aminopeptidase/acylaminoacyl peptidase